MNERNRCSPLIATNINKISSNKNEGREVKDYTVFQSHKQWDIYAITNTALSLTPFPLFDQHESSIESRQTMRQWQYNHLCTVWTAF